MLTTCTECKQVIEISTLREHLLDECDFSALFRPCPTCGDAVHERDYDGHVSGRLCSPPNGLKCGLCHEIIGKDEGAWRRHLVTDGCHANPRS
jgi:centrosomal protein CEP104